MNLNRIGKLLRVVEARTRLEQSRLAALAQAQTELLAEAEALRAAARTALETSEEISAMALRFYGARQEKLERDADARLAGAEALETRKTAQAGALRASLRQEIAWESLSSAAQQERRDDANAREEEKREALAQLRDRSRA